MKIRKSVIFFAAAAMIFLWGCENRVEYDPEEILVTINTDNWLTGNIGTWKIIHQDAGSLSLPELPADVLNAVSPGFKLRDQLSGIMSIRVTAFEDSCFQDYDDAVDQTLDPKSFPEENYFRLADRKLLRP